MQSANIVEADRAGARDVVDDSRHRADAHAVQPLHAVGRDAPVGVDHAQQTLDGHVVSPGLGQDGVHPVHLSPQTVHVSAARAPPLTDRVAPDPHPPAPRLGVDDAHSRRADHEVIDVGARAGKDEVV